MLKKALIRRSLWRDEQNRIKLMPPKIRDLIAELERAGFVSRGGKGSHRNVVHPNARKPVAVSGKLGDGTKHYQVRAVRLALEESKK